MYLLNKKLEVYMESLTISLNCMLPKDITKILIHVKTDFDNYNVIQIPSVIISYAFQYKYGP